MQIILGTANLSKGYGIASQNSDEEKDKAYHVLEGAFNSRITTLDTAPNYGESEIEIGKYHESGNIFNCYSKIPNLVTLTPAEAIESLQNSIKNLKVSRLSGIYFHNAQNLLEQKMASAKKICDELLNSKLVEKVGASVYSEDEIALISERFPEISLYQVPENILDRRLVDSKIIQKLHSQGVEFHVRSVFLQGLLLMELKQIPKELKSGLEAVKSLEHFAKSYGVTRLDSCINYVNSIPWANGLVVGAANILQLDQIVNFTTFKYQNSMLPIRLHENIVDPRNWNL
jgi:aryl-alcohol dehydrogenase-like predicted oxidoreductase